MNNEEINDYIEDLLEVACCPDHDYSCKQVYKYIKQLQQENQQLKEIITEARKYIIIELLDDNLEWHRNNNYNITGSDLPNEVILKIVDILERK